MVTFIALYRGASVGSAKMVAVSADQALAREFATRLLDVAEDQEQDAVVRELQCGRNRALRLVRDGRED